MEETITKYTKEIAKAEGFDIKVKFRRLYVSGKKINFGRCWVKKNRIDFNKFITFKPMVEEWKLQNQIWNSILHEITHLKDLPKTVSLVPLRQDRFSYHGLQKGEYIDYGHNLTFWKNFRRIKRKYAKLKPKFMEKIK